MHVNENHQSDLPLWEIPIQDLIDKSQNQNTTESADAAPDLKVSGKNQTSGSYLPVLEKPHEFKTVDELLNILLTVKTKLANTQIGAAQSDVESAGIKQKQKHDEIMEQIQKSLEASKKAKKGGVFGKIFGWVASIATAIAAAAMIATGVGAIAGAAMLALAVDSMVGMATGHSLMGELTKGAAKALQKMGMGEMAANIVAAVVVAAATIVATAGAGAASAARAGTGLITRLSSSMQQAQKFQVMGTQVKNVSLVAAGASDVGSGAASVTTGVYNKQAKDARADQMLSKKDLAKLQALIEAQAEWIKDVVAMLNESVSRIMQIMNTDHSTRVKTFRNMA